MWSLSSSVYPAMEMISMRSRSGPGMVSSMLAVQMNITLREVEGQVEVVVAEGVVLLRVEHLEHGAGGVAPPVGAHLVDLVDHEHRVVAFRRRGWPG